MAPAALGRAVATTARRALSTATTTNPYRGVWPIMATPFRDDESLDLDGFRRSVEFMATTGAAGCTIVGVLGESNRLTDKERERLIACAVAAAPGFPICVGTSHAGTKATVDLSQMAQELGAAAVMVTPTKEAAPTPPAALKALYAAVQDGCPGLDIVLQDHPASTQVFMSSDLILDICADLEAVRCIKLEAVPTPPKIAALRAAWAERPPASVGGCTILTGLGALYAGFDRGWNRRSRCLQDASVPEHAVVSADYPRGGRGRAAARLRGISTWQPRRRCDPFRGIGRWRRSGTHFYRSLSRRTRSRLPFRWRRSCPWPPSWRRTELSTGACAPRTCPCR